MLKNRDLGRLIIRIGLGLMFVFHGWPKLVGGYDTWASLGGKMEYLGIDFLPVFWGFMASVSEFVGGIFILFGFQFRIASTFLMFTMLVASAYHLGNGDSLGQASHAIELFFIFLGLILVGPGRYSIDG